MKDKTQTRDRFLSFALRLWEVLFSKADIVWLVRQEGWCRHWWSELPLPKIMVIESCGPKCFVIFCQFRHMTMWKCLVRVLVFLAFWSWCFLNSLKESLAARLVGRKASFATSCSRSQLLRFRIPSLQSYFLHLSRACPKHKAPGRLCPIEPKQITCFYLRKTVVSRLKLVLIICHRFW